MYRFYLIILLLGVVATNTFAQKTIERETYESAVDHLNCELAKFYILAENQGEYVHQAYLESLALFPCSFEHLMVFIQERQPQLEDNGYLAVYIEQYKDEFDNQIVNGALYNKLMDVFKHELLLAHEGNEDYQNLKITLKNYLEETLKIHELQTLDGIKDTQKESFNLWEWLKGINGLLLIVGLLFLFFFVMIFRWAIKYINTGKYDKPLTDLAANKNQQITENTQTINERFKPKSPKPIPKVATLKKTDLKKKTEAVINATSEKVVEEEPEEAIFYMPYPSIDGSFYELGNSEIEKDGQSTFKFKLINEKYALATFEILSNDKIITDIFMDYERTIKSVCDIKDNPKHLDKVIRPGITKIITIEAGTAQQTAQHWRVKKKAIIRFEYE